jgi:tryptophan synthase alpha chain
MRIEDKFKQLRKERKKAFIAYVPFGFPKIKYTKDIILTLQESGVDIIELGIPFSDPLADGPIIQKATFEALRTGANIKKLIAMLDQIKGSLKIPIVIMTYYNPLFRFGIDKFFKKMSDLGVSGITIVDLPVEESKFYISQARKFKLETIFFVTPTTSFERAKKIVKSSQGFIYYISVTGITGPKELHYQPLISHINQLKKITKVPICIGFGIHNRKQVKKLDTFSDGVIVGSSIVKFIEKNYSKSNFLSRLKSYIKSLKGTR